ncbi:MAG: TldD/PmbA family protein [Coriobacteriia bacterium]|nr:TldD/PmbA family protein [Coriobacteriia bacterium]
MRETVEAALDAARVAGASYADARIVDTTDESVSVSNGRVEGVESSVSAGVGVRVLLEGAWGFASTADTSRSGVDDCARRATDIARASGLVPGNPVHLAELTPVIDTWHGPCQKDPFDVSIEDKLGVLLAADEYLRAEAAVKITKSKLGFQKVRKWFGSTEGSYIEQEYVESGGGIVAYAIKDGEVLPRSYPNSHGGQWVQGGWESIESLDLVGNAPRIAEEAAALLAAQSCPIGEVDLIIDATQLALQVHESIGHPTELDRVLGDETAFAGTSFLTLEDLGVLRYGSDHVSVTADATVPGSLGSFGYDDEGVPAQRDYLIRNGLFSGFLTSRESALAMNRTSNGCMRADGWNRMPLIRMTTVSLEPGEWSFDDLVADTDEGLYVETNNSWSIDDRRLNFQFACEIGWEIKGGKIGRMVKNPNYTGITPRFWNACDAVCSRDHWSVSGVPNCGKGEPMQVAHVAHGASPARFRGIRTGVGR